MRETLGSEFSAQVKKGTNGFGGKIGCLPEPMKQNISLLIEPP